MTENNINYIVGARLGNLLNELIEQIDKNVPREDDKSIRTKKDNGFLGVTLQPGIERINTKWKSKLKKRNTF